MINLCGFKKISIHQDHDVIPRLFWLITHCFAFSLNLPKKLFKWKRSDIWWYRTPVNCRDQLHVVVYYVATSALRCINWHRTPNLYKAFQYSFQHQNAEFILDILITMGMLIFFFNLNIILIIKPVWFSTIFLLRIYHWDKQKYQYIQTIYISSSVFLMKNRKLVTLL